MKIKDHILKKLVLLTLFGACTAAAGTVTVNLTSDYPVWRSVVKAGFVKDITVKNAMNHPAWKKIPAYSFRGSMQVESDLHAKPAEGAVVQYLYSKEYFFIRAEFVDSDILSTGKENQTHLYLMGDLLEVFIKPLKDHYYWEVYGTPQKLFTRFYFPSRGRLLNSCFGPTDVVIPVETKLHGTFNKFDDRDKGWDVVICVPRKELEKHGIKFEKGSIWTVFAARYNYSRYLKALEHSSYPQINGNYHNTEHYAIIEFVNID